MPLFLPHSQLSQANVLLYLEIARKALWVYDIRGIESNGLLPNLVKVAGTHFESLLRDFNNIQSRSAFVEQLQRNSEEESLSSEVRSRGPEDP